MYVQYYVNILVIVLEAQSPRRGVGVEFCKTKTAGTQKLNDNLVQ